MNIVLCGMMGCGKTTVARELEKLTGMARVDTDEEVVKLHGRIADIFAKYGEERFREIETEVVAQISSRDGIIVATGGGCVLRDKNVSLLKAGGRGKIFFLRTQEETLISRVEGDTERPLLYGGARQKIAQLLPERTPKYEAAADYIVDTDGVAPSALAEKIARLAGVQA